MQDLEEPSPTSSTLKKSSARKPAETGEAVLHLLCGRIAAGKSTLAKSLARRHNAILIGEDDCLKTLYPTEISRFKDYLSYSERFKKIVAPHCKQLLQQGVSVVLDFPANTLKSRRWLKSIVAETNARHLLHYVTTPVEKCKQQLRQRMEEEGENHSPIALRQFDEINRYFVPPSVEEGFNVEIKR